jgi:hypothetical protein
LPNSTAAWRLRDFQQGATLVMNFFRKTPTSITGHEAKIADLARQIADAEQDLAHAEAASVDAALDGTGLGKTTDEVVRTVAALGALKTAKAQVEAELTALHAAAAEAALTAKLATAQTRVSDWKRHAQELTEKGRATAHRDMRTGWPGKFELRIFGRPGSRRSP